MADAPNIHWVVSLIERQKSRFYIVLLYFISKRSGALVTEGRKELATEDHWVSPLIGWNWVDNGMEICHPELDGNG